MKTFTYHEEQFVRKPLRTVFEFFERPENLALITPPALGFRVLTPSPILMTEGTVIDYSIRVAGIRMRWKSLISDYDPPNGFTDIQRKGPYAYWHHVHTFTETAGGTLIVDDVRYALPFGLIGRAVRRLVVRKQLEQIFTHRSRVIDDIFHSRDGFTGGISQTSNQRDHDGGKN